MTRGLEERMQAIQEGKETKQNVLKNATETLTLVTAELKSKEAAIGAQLSQALQRGRLEEKTVGTCPTCGGTTDNYNF